MPKKQLEFLDDWMHVRQERMAEEESDGELTTSEHGSALAFASVEEAFIYLRTRSGSTVNVLVTGSLHLVGAVYEYIK